MADRRWRIVLPDTSADTLALLRETGAWARLTALGEVTAHEGQAPDDATFAARVANADAVLLAWAFPAAVLDAAPGLRVISFAGAGVGSYVDVPAATARGIRVCAVKGYGDVSVAEHALALTLAVLRHVPAAHGAVAGGGWAFAPTGRDLSGATVGIVGWGGIGQAFARLLTGFDTTLLAWTRRPPVHTPGVRFTTLEALARQADVIALHLASTDETRGIISAEVIGAMKRDAVLVNTARGDLVDEPALVAALTGGRLAGAGLDVFAEEPLSAHSPLRHLANVVLTPHIAYRTAGARRRLYLAAIENLIDGVASTIQLS